MVEITAIACEPPTLLGLPLARFHCPTSGLRCSAAAWWPLAESNAARVMQIRTILENLSIDVATPAEAREILAFKGAASVAFCG